MSNYIISQQIKIKTVKRIYLNGFYLITFTLNTEPDFFPAFPSTFNISFISLSFLEAIQLITFSNYLFVFYNFAPNSIELNVLLFYIQNRLAI